MRTLVSMWGVVDRTIILTTEICIAVVGTTFTIFLVLSVVGRYSGAFAFMFVEAGARFLLVWFFFLGAGLALRERAHVGFELLRQILSPEAERVVTIVAHLTVLFFLALLLYGAPDALELASMDFEATIGLSSFWATLAVPVGVFLMAYHQICILTTEPRVSPKAEID